MKVIPALAGSVVAFPFLTKYPIHTSLEKRTDREESSVCHLLLFCHNPRDNQSKLSSLVNHTADANFEVISIYDLLKNS